MSKTNGNGKSNGKPKVGRIGTLLKAKKDLFLACLEETANVERSAKAAGVGKSTVYANRKRDEVFAAEWDDALSQGVASLEIEARRRAKDGTDKTVFHNGEKCGAIKQYSDNLLMFLLKAHKPEMYRENINMNLHHTGAVELRFAGMSRQQAKEEVVNRLQGLLTDE